MEGEGESFLAYGGEGKRRFTLIIGALVIVTLILAITTIIFLALFIHERGKSDDVAASPVTPTPTNPADDFPLYKADPWDISANHSRTLEFTSTQSTWTNVDLSPDGKLILFDCLGDIYTVPIEGGTATVLVGGVTFDTQPRYSPDGQTILLTSDRSGFENIYTYRLLDGLWTQITNEGYQYYGAGAWAENGSTIIATKWCYATERSIPGGEIWSIQTDNENPFSTAQRLRAKVSFSSQVGPQEPLISKSGDVIYWSENVVDSITWNYNKDPHSGIFVIKRMNLNTSEVTTVAGGPGSAARPILSHSETHLAFIRRTGYNTSLLIQDLSTGNEIILWRGLEFDLQESSCTLGVYPTFAFTPDDQYIVIWAKGQFYKVPVFDSSEEVVQIPVQIPVNLSLADTVRFNQSDHIPTMASFNPRVAMWGNVLPSNNNNSTKLLFNAVGRNFYTDLLPIGVEHDIVELYPEAMNDIKSEASWILNNNADLSKLSDSLVGRKYLQVSWNDVKMTTIQVLEVGRNDSGLGVINLGMPGRYVSARISPYWKESTQSPDIYYSKLLYSKLGGSGTTGSLFSQNTGVYTLDIEYNITSNTFETAQNSTPQQVLSSSYSNPRWVSENVISVQSGWFPNDYKVIYYNLLTKQQSTKVACKYCTLLEVSPDQNWVVFQEFSKIYASRISYITDSSPVQVVSSRPQTNPTGTYLIGSVGGHEIFYGSHNNVYWILANEIHSIDLNNLQSKCSPDLRNSTCAQYLTTPTPLIFQVSTLLSPERNNNLPTRPLCFYNATILTMKHPTNDIITSGTLVIQDDKIIEVGEGLTCPQNAIALNLNSSILSPGFIDVHAHFGSGGQFFTQNSWEYLVNLAYGVTTLHNPSATTQDVFYEAELIRSGSKIGPRIFSTGTVLYGCGGPLHVEVNTQQDAEDLIFNRLKYGAYSVKSYQQPSRVGRQRLLQAARTYRLNVVPEGGMQQYWNMNMAVDGHATVEHNLPCDIHNDTIQLFSRSGTALIPTLIVNYGGLWGENYFYNFENVWENTKLNSWTDRMSIMSRSMRRPNAYSPSDYHHIATSQQVTQLYKAGGIVGLGAHGQLQGLGYHWELKGFSQGGMSNMEVLNSATWLGARSMGVEDVLGSLEVGKLGDVVVFENGANPLERIEDARLVEWVVKDGRVWEAKTMNQIYPEFVELPKLSVLNTEDVRSML